MNRRRFLELLGMATVGGAVAYSFPKIIVPKNIQVVGETIFFIDTSQVFRIVDSPEFGFGFSGFKQLNNGSCTSQIQCDLGRYQIFPKAIVGRIEL